MRQDCLEPELLAVYLELGCDEDESQRIESHLVACADCRRIVALVISSKAAVPDRGATRRSEEYTK